jgi:hypothetical protein
MTELTLQRWLLLIHQLPSKPAYFRVKIWRRLQQIGAVAVKSAVYALPASADTREDFEWLRKEIVEGGGEAIIWEARLIDGLTDAQVRGLFDAARDTAYEAITREAQALGRAADSAEAENRADLRVQLGRLRKRVTEIVAIDFFGAHGRESAEALLAAIEDQLRESDMTEEEAPTPAPLELKGRIWVTRKGVHVDRIACSWLIRRFIDAGATFRFVAKDYTPEPGELRFDMFEGEFTHEGDRCSFEVLLSRAGLDDVALHAIGEIVHDIDLKDGKFAREETAGISHLIAGIAIAHEDDEQRIAAGAPLFDNLYDYFRKAR